VCVGGTTLSFTAPGGQRSTATTIAVSANTSGLISLLFTDLASSTALLDRLGDAVGGRLMREHFALLRLASAFISARASWRSRSLESCSSQAP
jgi:hypothetical protein